VIVVDRAGRYHRLVADAQCFDAIFGIGAEPRDEARLRKRDMALRTAAVIAQPDLRQPVDALLDHQMVLKAADRADVVAVAASDQLGPLAGF
jgi:hypothetical protein